GGEDGAVSEQVDEFCCFLCADAPAELRVGERTLELGEQRLGDDELEHAGEPAAEQLSRRPGRGEQGRDQDVRIEDGAHSAPSPTRLVLCLDGKCKRLLFVEVVALPEAVQQVEAEL